MSLGVVDINISCFYWVQHFTLCVVELAIITLSKSRLLFEFKSSGIFFYIVWTYYCSGGFTIFVNFVFKLNHRIWFPPKRIIYFKLYTRSSKPLIQESTNYKQPFSLTTKIDTHKYKYFHGILWYILCNLYK